jgi:hypothetical protein
MEVSSIQMQEAIDIDFEELTGLEVRWGGGDERTTLRVLNLIRSVERSHVLGSPGGVAS